MAASEDGEDCAMKYLKEQQKNPSGPRKTKPRCESDAAMEYLKGQLAKQKKTATGRTSPKVPLPDYLKGIRLQAPQTERSPEPSTRTASNPNSPGKIEAPQVRDAYFSPGSDVRKTLDLMQKVGAAPPAPPSHGPLSPGGPQGSVGPGPGVTRSASAKRIRPQAAASPTQCSQCSQCSPPSPLSWTTRSLRVPVQSAPCPSSPPGRSVPSFRELELEAKEETVAAVASPPASWVKTYTDILEKSQKSQGGPGVRAARLESPVRRVVPGGAKNFQSGLVSPMQTWRSGRPPPPPPPATVVGSVPIDLVSLTSGSLRLPPGEEANPGYHSARICVPEATEVAKQETTETAETRVVDTKSAKDEKSGNEDSQVAMKVDSQENAHPKDLEISPPPRAALTPCNFTGASTPNPSPKKPWEGTEIKSEKTLEKTPEQTHENRPPCEKPDLRSQPRLVPSGAWSPAPGFFRVHRDCMKPVQHTVAETTSTTSAGSGTGRIQGISTCITPSVMPCSTPPMPMTPPLPWHRVTGFELKPGQPGQTCLTREHTAASASARSAMATSTPMTSATTQWLPPKVGVYRTYSVTAAVPWFPKTEQRPWNPQQGSPLRRRQIKV